MLPYLHILIRVEDDGSLHAIGAFTTKEKQLAYQKDSGLKDTQVRLDFYNGPFEADLKVIYAGHRNWSMDLYQLAGYFKSEDEAWTWVTQEGYVSVLRIDTTYQEAVDHLHEALERYARLQRRWRLATYKELIAREGIEKTSANIQLRYVKDGLESFKPKTRRDIRALYACAILTLSWPLVVFCFLNDRPEYGEHVESVSWLPEYTRDISYYHSRQVRVFEFKVSDEDFKRWAESRGMTVRRLTNQEIISRYKAYIPHSATTKTTPPIPSGGHATVDPFETWKNDLSAKIDSGLIAESPSKEIAILDSSNNQAYFQHLAKF